MRTIRLFIADVDSNHINRVRQAVQRHRQLEVVGSAGDGNEALEQIVSCRPDVLLTGIQLPGLDGIMLLKDLQSMAHPPISIICTKFYSEMCIARARSFGAAYFMYKPIDYGRIIEIILELYNNAQRAASGPGRPSLESHHADSRANAARSVIRQLGIPAKLSGSQYLIEAILRVNDNAALMRNLSKGLYAEIASRMDTTPSGVERSLRNAIATGYIRGELQKRFQSRPSNKEFLQYLLQCVDESLAPADDIFQEKSSIML